MAEMEPECNQFSLRPTLSCEKVKELAEDVFGLVVDSKDAIKEMHSYLDRNYCIVGTLLPHREIVGTNAEEYGITTERYVLKVMNACETFKNGESLLDATDACMRFLDQEIGRHVPVPVPQKTVNGTFKALVCFPAKRSCLTEEFVDAAEKVAMQENLLDLETASEDRRRNLVHVPHYVREFIFHGRVMSIKQLTCNSHIDGLRLLTFIEGVELSCISPTDDLLYEAGKLAARVSAALQKFSAPSFKKRQSIIDIKNFAVLGTAKHLNSIPDVELRRSICSFLKKFDDAITPLRQSLSIQIIHSDISENNVVVHSKEGKPRISGLIDFGDVIHSYGLSEIANCMAHNGALRGNPLEDCGIVLSGYLSECNMTRSELDLLYFFVTGRFVQGVVLGFKTMATQRGSTNEYVEGLTAIAVKWMKLFLDHLHEEKRIVESWCNKSQQFPLKTL